MAAETGVFHEATKYAINHDLPITFVVEDNTWAVYTPTRDVWGITGNAGCHNVVQSSAEAPLERILDHQNLKVMRYKYERGYPHHGIGIWIEFPEEKDRPKTHIDDYHTETNAAMRLLAENPRAIFVGQTVGYPGSPIFKSLEGIPEYRRIEMPVIEETQMGAATGMALAGYLPISIFPRFDFMILGTNQLVNHLDKMYELSQGQFDPKVIIRTAVGTKNPINPGPQHCQDHTEAYSRLLTHVNVRKIESADQLVPAYQEALDAKTSTLLIESAKLLNAAG
jgi:hypothetical protein